MHSTRPARRLIAGAGIAIAALTLAACAAGSAGSGSAGATESSSSTGSGTTEDSPIADGGGLAAGIVESGSGEADPELIGLGDDADGPIGDRISGKSFTPRASEGFTFVDPAAMRFEFPTADQISIVGGCNAQFGDLEWDGATVKAPTLSSTLMACDQPLMDQDMALATLLADGVAASLDGDVLTLTSDRVTIELVDQHVPVGSPSHSDVSAPPVPDPNQTTAHAGPNMQ